MSVDPITGLPSADDSSQETQSSALFRPQSPLVRGSHLDKSVDRSKKRQNKAYIDHAQTPAKRGELHGPIPPVYGVVHHKERLDHMVDVIECVIGGKEEFVSEEEVLQTYPPNLEKTRFTMSKKKLRLQFIDDILDRFEGERWLYPNQFERRRKLWHKSVARSLKFINKFLEKESSNTHYVRPLNHEESIVAPVKTVVDSSSIPRKRGRKAKGTLLEGGIDAMSKLTLPASLKKITTESSTISSPMPSANTCSKKPIFGKNKSKMREIDTTAGAIEQDIGEKEKKRGKKKVPAKDDSDASSPKKRRKGKNDESEPKNAPAVSKAKKPAFGGQMRGKKGAVTIEMKEGDENNGSCATSSLDAAQRTDIEKSAVIGEASTEITDDRRMRIEKDDKMNKRLEVYEQLDEEKPLLIDALKAADRIVVTPKLHDDGMETDDDEWEPDTTPRETTPPRGLLSASQDPILLPSSQISHSSQSLFGSLTSSLIGSPNTSFSSQNSFPLLAPSIISSFNLSSSLAPLHPIATSTQIPSSQPSMQKEESGQQEKNPTTSGPKVRPTFGRRK